MSRELTFILLIDPLQNVFILVDSIYRSVTIRYFTSIATLSVTTIIKLMDEQATDQDMACYFEQLYGDRIEHDTWVDRYWIHDLPNCWEGNWDGRNSPPTNVLGDLPENHPTRIEEVLTEDSRRECCWNVGREPGILFEGRQPYDSWNTYPYEEGKEIGSGSSDRINQERNEQIRIMDELPRSDGEVSQGIGYLFSEAEPNPPSYTEVSVRRISMEDGFRLF